MAISANDGRLSPRAGTNQSMDVYAAPVDPFLVDALDAAATDADAIHHDLCAGAVVPGRLTGPCSCGVPALIRELSQLVDARHSGQQPSEGKMGVVPVRATH